MSKHPERFLHSWKHLPSLSSITSGKRTSEKNEIIVTPSIHFQQHDIPLELFHQMIDFVESNVQLLNCILVNKSWCSALKCDEEYWKRRTVVHKLPSYFFPTSSAADAGMVLHFMKSRYNRILTRYQDIIEVVHAEFGKGMGHVLVLGAEKVGRSSFLDLIHSHSIEEETTREVAIPEYHMGESTLRLYVAEYPFSSHTTLNVIIYLFDLTNEKSLESMKILHQGMLKKNWIGTCDQIMIGLKKDLKQNNTLTNKAFEYCVQNENLMYMELSCLENPEEITILENMLVELCIKWVLE